MNTLFDPHSCLSMYPSRANFYEVTQTKNSTSQLIDTFAVSVNPLLLNRPCRKSPLILIRPQNQETRESTIQRIVSNFQLNFVDYINVTEEILLRWNVQVDGVMYEIDSVEGDGNKLTTRLMISIPVPFNA